MCVFLTGTDVFADTAKWYEGGTLHKATVKKWRNSSYKNRLATAADWFSAITKTHNPELKKKLDNLNNDQWLLAVKAFDQQLEKCVSDTVAETILFKPDDQVAKIAALCYKSMLRSQEPEDKNKPSLYADPTERDGWERAVEIVKNLPCSEGGTIGQYLNKKAAIPAVEDLNWNVSARDYGFEVERKLLIDQRMKAIYRWRVDSAGNTKPLNGKAMGITPGYFSTKPKDKSLPGYQETFEEWQPYKDYLKLGDKYKSPAFEKLLRESYEVEIKVKYLPCSKGGTIDQYFSLKPRPPAVDLGWDDYKVENGVNVVRKILLDVAKPEMEFMEYIWHIDLKGKVTPLNDNAIEITKKDNK